ncbi:MAG: hypothetical protein C0404_12400 [Verrucomicrobia bacterium]|nr:hypothetical protein [Verrucomicrobiota bacterium]
MKTRDEIYWARWLLLPCALWAILIGVTCSLAFIKHQFLQSSDYIFWHNADFWISCLTGVICGFAWVAVSGTIVPSHKLPAGVVSCVPGALLAWVLMDDTYYRVESNTALQDFPTYAPFCLCVWSGLVGLFAIWRLGKRAHLSLIQGRRVPRVLRVTVLVFAGFIFCTLVVPSGAMMWRFALYHSALHTITEEGDEKALHALRRLVKVPLFDLDWTPGRVLRMIPFGHRIDMEMFGCPSCRGIHTPLFHIAAARGHKSLLREMLLWRGAPDYCGDNGQGALSAAIRSHDTSTVALILSRGRALN